MGTCELVKYDVLGNDNVIVKDPAGGMTVTFAFPAPAFVELCAEALTPYVAGAIPPGTDLVIVADAADDGDRVRTVCEKLVGQELGSVELKSKLRGEQPAESLLVTDTM